MAGSLGQVQQKGLHAGAHALAPDDRSGAGAPISLWPDVEYAYRFVHAVAHGLGNPHEESAAMVRRRVNGVLGAMQQHRLKAGTLAGALDHFQKATRSWCPGLFHTYEVPDLPRTNDDPEQLFGSQRYHERRATGRKTAAPGAVLRGSVRRLAATAIRVPASTALELGAANQEHWTSLRQRRERSRRARTLRTCFRHDPAVYLASVEPQACQLALPSEFFEHDKRFFIRDCGGQTLRYAWLDYRLTRKRV